MTKELVFNEIVVRLDDRQETVWLSQKQMAELFGRSVPTINAHLKKALEEGEITPDSVIRNFLITAADGKNYEVAHYNLDAILAVGYRVKSPVGTHFRQWATQQLRQILLGQRQAERERELWNAFHAAKTGAVQLSVLAALGVPVGPAGTGRRPLATARVAAVAADLWSAVGAVAERLQPEAWLRPVRQPDCPDALVLVDVGGLRADLLAAGGKVPGTEADLRAALRAGPGARPFNGQVRFGGRRVRPACLPPEALPEWLRDRSLAWWAAEPLCQG